MTAKDNENNKGVDVEFTVRHTIFAVAALALITFFPMPSDKTGDWDEWVNTQANHFTADVIVDFYRYFHDPESSQVIHGDYDTLDFLSKGAGGQLVRRRLVIGTDDLYSRGMRLLLLSALFLVICPPRSIAKTRRFKKFLCAVTTFHLLFFVRALMMGSALCLFDAVPLMQTVDLPFRLLIVAFVLGVGMSTLNESPIDRREDAQSGLALQASLLLLALASFVSGCKGNISNNSVTINTGGGSGYTPYVIVAVMIGWSYAKDIRRKRRAERSQVDGKPWRKRGAGKRGAESESADDAADLI